MPLSNLLLGIWATSHRTFLPTTASITGWVCLTAMTWDVRLNLLVFLKRPPKFVLRKEKIVAKEKGSLLLLLYLLLF